jgi:hypothetical protein
MSREPISPRSQVPSFPSCTPPGSLVPKLHLGTHLFAKLNFETTMEPFPVRNCKRYGAARSLRIAPRPIVILVSAFVISPCVREVELRNQDET